MQSETIQLGQKIRYTVNCGKTWRVGTLTGYNEKTVTITTKKQVIEPTFYYFMGLNFLKYQTGTQKVWRDIKVTLNTNEACTSVLSLAQFKELQAIKRYEARLVQIALAS